MLADRGSFTSALDPLRETLSEEEAMAAWVDENIPALTEKYVALKRSGENPSR